VFCKRECFYNPGIHFCARDYRHGLGFESRNQFKERKSVCTLEGNCCGGCTNLVKGSFNQGCPGCGQVTHLECIGMSWMSCTFMRAMRGKA
jgi:hypothetical protein